MMAWMAPGATVKLTRSSALMPAKRTVTSRTASSGTSTPSRACGWGVTRPTESGACRLRRTAPCLARGPPRRPRYRGRGGAPRRCWRVLGLRRTARPGRPPAQSPGGHRQRHGRVLLDQQHRRTLPVDLGDDLPDLGDHARRESQRGLIAVSYTHLRAHETRHDLVCRLLLE